MRWNYSEFAAHAAENSMSNKVQLYTENTSMLSVLSYSRAQNG